MTPAERALKAVEQAVMNLADGLLTHSQFLGAVRDAVAAWRRETA